MATKPHSDSATFTFARANPPTTGHVKLVNAVKEHAAKTGGDHHIFLSHSQDSKKNPLSHAKKVEYLHKMAPGTNIHTESGIKTPIDALKHLHAKGYKHVTMFVGSDRLHDMHNLVHKYNGKDYKFDKLEVKSAGDRDPDAEGTKGMSASKMREHAQSKDFKSFQKGVANKDHARAMYHDVRKGMKLENYQALFLVGGPGSGKDFILRAALAESGAIEVPLGHRFAENFAQFPKNGQAMIINGNAYDHEKIMKAIHDLREGWGSDQPYNIAMVYVYTSNEDSQARNEARIKSGAKTITEASRAAKYQESIASLHEFKDLFGEGFFLFDNSNDFNQVNEETQSQVTQWINELKTAIESYFEKPVMGIAAPKIPKPTAGVPTGGHPVPSGQERVKKGSFNYLRAKVNPSADPNTQESVDTELNSLFEKTYPTIVDMIAKKEGPKEGNKYEGGIAIPGAKDKANGTSQVAESNQEVAVPQTSAPGVKYSKKKPAKGAPPINTPSDSRIGTVPSGGIGLTAINTEETINTTGLKKTFESMRKR